MKRFQGVAGALVLVIATSAASAKPGEAENVLRWTSATEALTFDPHSANNFPTIAANLQVYEPLVDFNSSSEIEPALAIAWQLINATVWQFDLRQGGLDQDDPETLEALEDALEDQAGHDRLGRRACSVISSM